MASESARTAPSPHSRRLRSEKPCLLTPLIPFFLSLLSFLPLSFIVAEVCWATLCLVFAIWWPIYSGERDHRGSSGPSTRISFNLDSIFLKSRNRCIKNDTRPFTCPFTVLKTHYVFLKFKTHMSFCPSNLLVRKMIRFPTKCEIKKLECYLNECYYYVSNALMLLLKFLRISNTWHKTN